MLIVLFFVVKVVIDLLSIKAGAFLFSRRFIITSISKGKKPFIFGNLFNFK